MADVRRWRHPHSRRPGARRAGSAVVAAALALSVSVGCTAHADTAMTRASPVPMTAAPTTGVNTSVSAGPTAVADAACPWLSVDEALDAVGERLGRTTTSTSSGALVGCTFYPDTGSLAGSEHLPSADTPVIDVQLTRYASVSAAHNAMASGSRAGTNAYQEDQVRGADEAVSYGVTFDPTDGNADRACAFRKGTAVVVVRIAQTRSALNAARVASDVAPRVA